MIHRWANVAFVAAILVNTALLLTIAVVLSRALARRRARRLALTRWRTGGGG